MAVVAIGGGVYFYTKDTSGDDDIYAFCGSGSPELKNIESLAISQKNPSICSRIKPPGWFGCGPGPSTEDLVTECYRDVGIELQDTAVCRSMSGYQEQCYTGIVSKTKNIAVCDEFRDLNDSTFLEGVRECYVAYVDATGDTKGCDHLPNKEKQFCYMYIYGSTDAVCKKMDPEYQPRCQQYFHGEDN